MEKTYKKLKKYIIENDVELIVLFKIPDYDILTHELKFNKNYYKGITYFEKYRMGLTSNIRFFCLKDLSNLILYKNKLEKLSEDQIKLLNIIYKKLNYIGIKKYII